MKTLKTSLFLLILFSFIFYFSKCSNDSITGQSTIKNNNTDANCNVNMVRLIVWEYVTVTPSDGTPYHEVYNIQDFSCSDGECFTTALPHQFFTNFVTPVSPRTVNGNTVTTDYFAFTYPAAWHGITNEIYGAYWNVTLHNSLTTYLRSDKFMTPGNCGTIDQSSTNVSMPSNTTVDVIYGTGTYGGDSKK